VKRALALALGAALALAPATTAGCKRAPATAEAAPPAALDTRHEPLRGRFDEARGAPRLVMLASPT
jgi:hypothetical protein